MAVLHILSNPNAGPSCVKCMADGDALLVVGNGVFALSELAGPSRTGVLAEDLESRGVGLPADVEGLRYADFVAWVVEYPSSVTWT